jgi:hypothetical protein
MPHQLLESVGVKGDSSALLTPKQMIAHHASFRVAKLIQPIAVEVLVRGMVHNYFIGLLTAKL